MPTTSGRMEDVIQTYQRPYDPKVPGGLLRRGVQATVRGGANAAPPAAVALRWTTSTVPQGVCHQLLMCEPLRGWRHVRVSVSGVTRKDYALCVREMVKTCITPEAKKIRLVQDNLNTRDGAEKPVRGVCAQREARRLLDKIEWHYTPKHGSWVNMAETEIGIMNGQCLDRRLDSQEKIATEVAAWESKRNAQEARIHWTFTLAVARQKLRKLLPVK